MVETAVRRWVAQYKAELNDQPGIGLPPGPQTSNASANLKLKLRTPNNNHEIPKKASAFVRSRLSMMLPIISQLNKAHPC